MPKGIARRPGLSGLPSPDEDDAGRVQQCTMYILQQGIQQERFTLGTSREYNLFLSFPVVAADCVWVNVVHVELFPNGEGGMVLNNSSAVLFTECDLETNTVIRVRPREEESLKTGTWQFNFGTRLDVQLKIVAGGEPSSGTGACSCTACIHSERLNLRTRNGIQEKVAKVDKHGSREDKSGRPSCGKPKGGDEHVLCQTYGPAGTPPDKTNAESDVTLCNKVLAEKINSTGSVESLIMGKEIYSNATGSLVRVKVYLAHRGSKLVTVKRFERPFGSLTARAWRDEVDMMTKLNHVSRLANILTRD